MGHLPIFHEASNGKLLAVFPRIYGFCHGCIATNGVYYFLRTWHECTRSARGLISYIILASNLIVAGRLSHFYLV